MSEKKFIDTKLLRRSFVIDRRKIDDEKRTVELSFSSEEPYPRWFGTEILGHGPGEVDLSFIGSGRAPLLVGHWTDDQVGVIEKATIGADRKGRAVVRFGKSSRADDIFQDVLDGIRTNISVGYHIQKMVMQEEDEETGAIYRAVAWKPLEASIVAIPADETVGVGRAVREEMPLITEIIKREAEPEKQPGRDKKKGEIMPEKTETKPEAATPAIDIEKIQKDTRAAEKDRVAELIALGEVHNLRTEAMQAVKDGKTKDQFRAFVLEKLSSRGLTPVDHGSDVGLTEKETRDFSFIKAINALANPSNRQAQEAAAFEMECSKAVADQMKRTPQGIMVPFEVLRRDLNVTTTTAGGFLVATDLMSASFIEILQNRMMTRTLGAITLGGLVGDVAIPKQTGGATAYWVAESTAVTESQQVLAQLALAPKTCGAFTDLSRKFLKQSSLDAEAFVRADLASCLALALDAAGIAGTGADDQPTGILATTGIGAVALGTNGLAPTWASIIGLETEVAIDNADLGKLAYLTNAKARGTLKQLEKIATTGQFVWENGIEPGFGMMNGYKAAASNQVPSDLTKGTGTALSAIIFGNWADLVYGLWGTVDIIVDPYTGSASGTVRVVALQDADVGVRHAQSFAAIVDAITA